jgi:hypothetical protein
MMVLLMVVMLKLLYSNRNKGQPKVKKEAHHIFVEH